MKLGVPCGLARVARALRSSRAGPTVRPPFAHPRIEVGSPEEYRAWQARARQFLREAGRNPASLDRVDATINYAKNRIILFNLPNPQIETSVSETMSHEVLHALLDAMGEWWAARTLDGVGRPVGDALRVGGI